MPKNKVISLENVGKSYLIGHENTERYTALRDIISNKVSDLITKTKGFFKGNQLIDGKEIEEFWALKNINFTVNQGDRIGIIGKNGAGKSTLLKVLSRITDPTTGLIKIKGKVSSLLEVGTGFHPELTGRENIYLNGAILGMNRASIKKKFDEIVDFAGVEKFLDTPVKRFSSGMYVRLAFAVAAHLDSEILIVDEVLAVGDADFQKKCLTKMNSLGNEEGKTVLFVSHNLTAMKSLCNKGILLDKGVKIHEGEIQDVINRYSKSSLIESENFSEFRIKELGTTVTKISIKGEEGGQVIPFKPLKIDIEMFADMEATNLGIEITLSHEDTNGRVFHSNTKTTDNIDFKLKKGKNEMSLLIESFDLCSGSYWLGFGIDIPFVSLYYHNSHLLSFEVPEVISPPRLLSTSPNYGHTYLKHEWLINK
jgi:lipopolysaccharide transport system ATP-binding protein